MSSRSYILQIMLWHQSLKNIHYRTLLIFQNKKNNRFEGQNMGGIKDMLSPPCQNMGGIYHPHPPQDLRSCESDTLATAPARHNCDCVPVKSG